MTKKIRKGYDWVEEQQDLWESISSEKMNYLNEITQSHLDWFDTHSTISELLAWKRSIANARKKNTSNQGIKVDSNSNPLAEKEDSTLLVNDLDNDLVDTLSQPENDDKNIELPKDTVDFETSTNNMEDGDQIVLCRIPKYNESKPSPSLAIDQLDKLNSTENTTETQQIKHSSVIANNNKPTKADIVDVGHNSKQDKDILINASPEIDMDKDGETVVNIAPEYQKSLKDNSERPLKQKWTEESDQDMTEDSSKRHSVDNNSIVPMIIEAYPITPPAKITTSSIKRLSKSDSVAAAVTKSVEDDFSSTPPELEMDLDSPHTTQKMPSTPEEDDDEIQLVTPHCQKQSEEEEDDDEIQLVVSTRNFPGDIVRTQRFANKSPIRMPTNTQSVISPPRNISTSLSPKHSPPVRSHSSFMSRLFQMGQSSQNTRHTSLKEDSPSPSNFITLRPSTSTVNSDKSNNLSMSLLENKNKKKRSLVVAEIEVSDAMPQSGFKRPKAVPLKKTPPNNIPAPQNEKREESTNNDAESKEADKEQDEEEGDEPTYLTPSWAKDPELYMHLESQKGLDPDIIFGRITPLEIEDIFAETRPVIQKTTPH